MTQLHLFLNLVLQEIAGVSYSNETYAVTVGSYGNVVKWDITSNIVKTFNHIKNFRPLCMACSPHVALNVAIGTKQGVVLVMDLNGKIFKNSTVLFLNVFTILIH